MAMSEIQRKALSSRVATSLSNSWELQFEEEEWRRKARKVAVGVTGSHDFIFSSECRGRKKRRERERAVEVLLVFDFLVSLF